MAETSGERGWRAWAQPVLLILAVGTFLAVLGPFGTNEIGLPWIWFYWTGFMALGAIFGFGTGHLTPRLFPGAPKWAAYVAAAATVSIPMTVAVSAVNTWLARDAFDWTTLPVTYLFVFVISAFVTSIVYVIERLGETPGAATETAGPSRALLDKLPPRLQRSALLALSAEDHYLRVFTQAGDALILMRFSDAMAAVETLDGAQTHRSWWVSRDAVDSVARGDGRAVLTLSNGVEAPVSRTYSKRLREQGWY